MDEQLPQGPPDELTLEQGLLLRNVSVAAISFFVQARDDLDKDVFDRRERQAEFALKVLDFVAG